MFFVGEFLFEVELAVDAGVGALVHAKYIIKELDIALKRSIWVGL